MLRWRRHKDKEEKKIKTNQHDIFKLQHECASLLLTYSLIRNVNKYRYMSTQELFYLFQDVPDYGAEAGVPNDDLQCGGVRL